MTDIMTQPSYGLNAPSSRQDIVSALLSEYGNSFGHEDRSPSAFSPVRSEKDLPPPPPRSDSRMNNPLPAVARAEKRMSMKFQLRVIEDAPLSPTSLHSTSPEQRSRRKIPFRTLSRELKPPSLNLVTSNGSTAIVPPTPVFSAVAQTFPDQSSYESKNLPSPPPPPPAKSERRSLAQSSMGLQQSKSQKELARNDSLLSQSEAEQKQPERPATEEAATTVKRKAVPAPTAKKFVSLAELGTGPRGGKGGPLPPTSAPRKTSVDSQTSSTSAGLSARVKEEEVRPRADEQQHNTPGVNQLPPTPEEDKAAVAAPAPPRKVALGLPSNPRAKKSPIFLSHVRGKSSTGFNLLKAQRPAPPAPNASMKLETITPEMTPSPTLKPEPAPEQHASPLSPLPPPKQETRRFSFEAVQPAVETMNMDKKQPVVTTIPITDDPEPAPDLAAKPAIKSTTPSPVVQFSPPQSTHSTTPPTIPADDRTPTPPPFTPLTRLPVAVPPSSIPPITAAHTHCYTRHASSTWSSNTFQPMGCMVCGANERDRKWKCTWCQLRICRGCSEELERVGWDLGALVEGWERREREREEMREEMREEREDEMVRGGGDVQREYEGGGEVDFT